MAAHARVTAVMLDGSKVEAEGPYMATADRIAFEELFSMAFGALGRDVIQERQAAFFSWCLLHREGVIADEFDVFKTKVEEIEIDAEESANVDPTEPDQPIDSSPS